MKRKQELKGAITETANHQEGVKMKVTFKTMESGTFTLEVGESDAVEDLVTQVEDLLGRENLYRLIYAGKVMKEEEQVSDLGMNGKLPVVVMMTKPSQNRREVEEGEVKMKRVRTVTEDSGFGDEEGEHFVTDREFTIALEVVVTCQNFRESDQPVTEEETKAMVEQMLPEEEEVREVIFSRMEEVQRAGLSRNQLRAFIVDIQSMHQEARDVPILEDLEELEDPEEVEDEELDQMERNLQTLEGMGFSREEGLRALGRSCGSLQVALDLLLPRGPDTPPPMPTLPNPLAFLRDVPEFNFLRVLVLQQPNLLQPLLLSFGQSHPEVMEAINTHKEQFVAMLYEQTGGDTSKYARHH